MSSIDNRVVQMNFNNREFEAGVAESKKSIEDLDKQLRDFGKDADTSSMKKAFSGVGDALDEVSHKFSIFEEVATGIFRRIGENIADSITGTLKSLTIDQITEGFSTYEDITMATAGLVNIAKVNMRKAVESNKASYADYFAEDGSIKLDLIDEKAEASVYETLDKLRWFAAATSFGINDMVTALQAAANAGMDLKDAAAVIMGIGTSITYAGQSATQSGGAFSMLAKVMGDQTVMTQRVFDSLNTTYKIITPEIQEAMAKTAQQMSGGKLTDENVKYITENFRSSLSTQDKKVGGWLTGKVVKQTYQAFGDYSEAISDLVSTWETVGGQTATAEEFWNVLAEGNDKLSAEDLKEIADELKIDARQVLTVTQAADLYDKVVAKTKQDLHGESAELNEQGRLMLMLAGEAKTFSEVIDAVKDASKNEWANIFESIFGNYTQAKQLFTRMNDFLVGLLVDPIANVAKTMKKWSEIELGGLGAIIDSGKLDEDGNKIMRIATAREALIEGVVNLWKALEAITGPIKEAWEAIFPSKTLDEHASKLAKITELFYKFTSSLIISPETQEVLKNVTTTIAEFVKSFLDVFNSEAVQSVFKAFTNIVGTGLKVVWDVIQMGIGILAGLWEAIKPAVKVIGQVIVYISQFINYLYNLIKPLGLLEKVTDVTVWKFNTLKKKIKQFFESFDRGTTVLESIIDAFKKLNFEGFEAVDYDSLTAGLTATFESMGTALDQGFSELLEHFKTEYEKFTGYIGERFDKFGDFLGKHIKTLPSKIVSGFKTAIEYIAYAIKTLAETMKSLFSKNEEVAAKSSKSVYDSYADAMKAMPAGLYLFIDIANRALKLVAKFIAVMAEARLEITLEKICRNIERISETLNKSLKNLTLGVKAKAIKDIAVALAILAGAIFLLSYMAEDPEKIATALGVMGAIMTGLYFLMKGMAKIRDDTKLINDLKKLGIGALFIELAVAMVIVAAAMAIIAAIPAAQYEQAIGGFTAVFVAMGVMMVVMTQLRKGEKIKAVDDIGVMMLKVASALLIIAKAMDMLSSIENIDKGIGALYAIMFALGLFYTAIQIVSSKFEAEQSVPWLKIGGVFIAMAIALTLIVGAIYIISKVAQADPGALRQTVITIGLIMAVMTGVVIALSKFSGGIGGKKLLSIAGVFIAMALAIDIMALAIIGLALLPTERMKEAAGMLMSVIIVVTAALGLLCKFAPDAARMAEMFGISAVLLGVALLLIANACKKIGELDNAALLKTAGIVAVMLGIFLVVGLLAKFMPELYAGMLTFSGATLLCAKDFLIFVGAMFLLTLIDTTALARKIVEFIVSFSVALVESADALEEAIYNLAIILSRLLVDLIAGVIIGILEGIGRISLIIAQALGYEGDSLLGSLGYLFLKLILWISNATLALAKQLGYEGDDIGKAIDYILVYLFKAFILWLGALVTEFGAWLSGKLDEIFNQFADWLVELANSLWQGALDAAADFIGGIVEGLKDTKIGEALTAIGGFASKLINEFNKKTESHSPSKKMMESASYMVAGIEEGIKKGEGAAIDEFGELATNMIGAFNDAAGIHSNSDEGIESGKYWIGGLGEGITEATPGLLSQVSDLSGSITSTLNSSLANSNIDLSKLSIDQLSSLNSSIDMSSLLGDQATISGMNAANLFSGSFADQLAIDGLDMSNLTSNMTITPVMDMSNFTNGDIDYTALFGDSTIQHNVSGIVEQDPAQMQKVLDHLQYTTDTLWTIYGKVDNIVSYFDSQPEIIVGALQEALSEMGVYMDERKVGNLVSKYQANTAKAGG